MTLSCKTHWQFADLRGILRFWNSEFNSKFWNGVISLVVRDPSVPISPPIPSPLCSLSLTVPSLPLALSSLLCIQIRLLPPSPWCLGTNKGKPCSQFWCLAPHNPLALATAYLQEMSCSAPERSMLNCSVEMTLCAFWSACGSCVVMEYVHCRCNHWK